MSDSSSALPGADSSGRRTRTSRSSLTPLFLIAMAVLSIVLCVRLGMDLWLTPDQQGRWLFHRNQFADAGEAFQDPMWQGVAWYRAGEFAKSAQAFARCDTATGLYNQGNAWLMRGEYTKATDCYTRALAKQPNWPDAIENRDLAIARAKMVEQTGGDMGDQTLGADKIVFDKKNNQEGQETKVDGAPSLSDQDVQAMWLRRVQTRPADFLKAKFAYQQAANESVPE